MTSQVFLSNGLGLVVASDSAVTLGSRVLNNQEKLFGFDSPHKLCAATSGRADLMNIPWQSVFSAWERSLQGSLAKVEDYGEALLEFLPEFIESMDLQHTEEEFLSTHLRRPGGPIDQAWEAIEEVMPIVASDTDVDFHENSAFLIIPNNLWERYMSGTPDREVREALSNNIEPRHSERVVNSVLSKTEFGEKLPDSSYWPESHNKIREALALHEESNGEIDSFLASKNWPMSDELLDAILDLWSELIFEITDDGETDLVLAGFGGKEVSPSFFEVSIKAVIAGQVVRSRYSNTESKFHPFYLFTGQTSALEALVAGDEDLYNITYQANQRVFNEILDVLENIDLPVKATDKIVEIIEKSQEQDPRKELFTERYLPFRELLHLCPLADLLDLSEKLVTVQAVKAALSQDIPTVGGHIDVASVSFKEGFQWAKRNDSWRS